MPYIREILAEGHPTLRKVAKKVDPREIDDPLFQQLIDDMFETMYAAPGVGLAAPQVNVSKRLFVMDVNDDEHPPAVVINPKLEALTEEVELREGCLSVPGNGRRDRPLQARGGQPASTARAARFASKARGCWRSACSTRSTTSTASSTSTALRTCVPPFPKRTRKRPRRERRSFSAPREFAVPSLRVVAARTQLVRVVTRPDRPAGRGLRLTPSPVKRAALELGLRARRAARAARLCRGTAKRGPRSGRPRGVRTHLAAGDARSRAPRRAQRAPLAAAEIPRSDADSGRAAKR